MAAAQAVRVFRPTYFCRRADRGNESWDRAREEVPLLGGSKSPGPPRRGDRFGSHSARHLPLARSRLRRLSAGRPVARILERDGPAVRTIAYPHGAEDRIVHHFIGACGYISVCLVSGFERVLFDPLLALPRVEITDSTHIDIYFKTERQPEH